MSEAEQDAAIGRMVKGLADGKRKLAAMTSELERYEKAFRSLASSLSSNVSDLKAVKRDIESAHPVLQGIGLASLLEFLEEYTEVRQSVQSGTARLRDLGI